MDLTDARVLAFGTTGAQGSGLVEALLARGARSVRVTSRPEAAAAWRAEGEDALLADLSEPLSVDPTVADAAVLHVPLSLGTPDGVGAVVATVRRLREAGLPVAVNIGTPVAAEDGPDPFGSRHLAEGFLATGATVLTPTAYLENHAAPWALGPIAEGHLVYPRPAHDPLAWVAARDMTAAGVAALAGDLGTRLLRLAGPQVLTFDDLAAELAAGLSRPLTFRRVTAGEYADLLRPVVGEAAATGVAAAYGAMPEEANPAMAVDAREPWALLGLEPTSARRWAAEVLSPALAARTGASA